MLVIAATIYRGNITWHNIGICSWLVFRLLMCCYHLVIALVNFFAGTICTEFVRFFVFWH